MPRATSRIVVFDGHNKYLGNYHVAMTFDLPIKIQDNSLVFENRDRDGCDPNPVTQISFAKGIPKEFFLACKNKRGDIFRFDDE